MTQRSPIAYLHYGTQPRGPFVTVATATRHTEARGLEVDARTADGTSHGWRRAMPSKRPHDMPGHYCLVAGEVVRVQIVEA